MSIRQRWEIVKQDALKVFNEKEETTRKLEEQRQEGFRTQFNSLLSEFDKKIAHHIHTHGERLSEVEIYCDEFGDQGFETFLKNRLKEEGILYSANDRGRIAINIEKL